jgi:hypothetical protein
MVSLSKFICQYVHTISAGAHIMLKKDEVPQINLDELSEMKIPTLRGRARASSLLILETIAMEGPLLKYGVYKRLEKKGIPQYSTVTRRIDHLREKGYLNEAGQRNTERGKRKAESLYGLTWKGLIASLASQKVRENALQTIEKNPLLAIPEKEFVLLIISDIFDHGEVERITTIFLYGYLKAIPNLENIEEEELAIWIPQAIREIPPDILRFIEISDRKKNLTKLLDNPRILQYVKQKIIPKISEYERIFYTIFQFFKVLDQLGDFINNLDPEDKPSERLKEYLKTMRTEDRMLE